MEYTREKKRLDSCLECQLFHLGKQGERSSNHNTVSPIEGICNGQSASMNSALGQSLWYHRDSTGSFS